MGAFKKDVTWLCWIFHLFAQTCFYVTVAALFVLFCQKPRRRVGLFRDARRSRLRHPIIYGKIIGYLSVSVLLTSPVLLLESPLLLPGDDSKCCCRNANTAVEY